MVYILSYEGVKINFFRLYVVSVICLCMDESDDFVVIFSVEGGLLFLFFFVMCRIKIVNRLCCDLFFKYIGILCF